MCKRLLGCKQTTENFLRDYDAISIGWQLGVKRFKNLGFLDRC